MKNRRERGEVVVEASVIVTLVLIVISIMFYIGMFTYQQTALATVANRTATSISLVYSNTLRDPFTGYIDPDSAYQAVTYGSMKTDAYIESVRQKGTAFALYRLKKAQIIPAADREVDVQVVNKPNEILKGQIVVTVTDTYEVPLVGMFGLDNKLTVTATGRADCVDYTEYLLGVAAIADPEQSVVPSLPDSDTCVVTFIKDKYSGDFCAAVPVLRGKTIITSNRQSHSVMPSNPVFNNMKFTGWVTADGNSFSASVQVNDSMTVYGTWSCQVTLDPTGGTVSPSSVTAVYKKAATLPTPQKYGFEFLGWYSEVEYSQEYKCNNGTGTKYTSGQTEIPGNITLYARWRCMHAAYTDVKINDGDCKTKSTWRHDCKTCNYSYETRGAYGSHKKGESRNTVEPSCTTGGRSVVKCTVCNAVMSEQTLNALGHRYASGSSGAYDTPYHRDAACNREGIDGSRCSRCGAEKGRILPKTDHDWSGKCNVNHNMRHDPIKITSHDPSANYTESTVVRCYLCVNCGAPNGGWRTKKRDIDGRPVSEGVICGKHNDDYGVDQTDEKWYTNKDVNIHEW